MKAARFAKQVSAGLLFLSFIGIIHSLVVADAREAQANSSESVRLNSLEHGGAIRKVTVDQDNKWAQPFCTGNTSATLTKVRLWTEAASLGTDDMPTVSIFADGYGTPERPGREGRPGRRVHTLTIPSLDGSIGTSEDFTSSGFELDPSSRYWVVVERPSDTGTFRLAIADVTTISNEIDTGWSLPARLFTNLVWTNGTELWEVSDKWDSYYTDHAFSMALYATGDRPDNYPPVLFGRECSAPVKPFEISVDENTPRVTFAADDTEQNNPIITRIGTLRARDIEDDTLTFSLSGPDLWKFNRLFELNTSTGAITIKEGVSINFEEVVGYGSPIAFHNYHLTVSVTDGKDDSGVAESAPTPDDTAPLTFRVNNVDEPPRVTFRRTVRQGFRDVSVDVTTPTVGQQFRVVVLDEDGFLGSGRQTSISRGDNATGPWTPVGWAVDHRYYTPVAADEGKYLRAVVGYINNACHQFTPILAGKCRKSVAGTFSNPVVLPSSQQQGAQQQSNVGGRSAPAGPTFSYSGDTVTFKVAENAGGNTRVATLDATDPNNDPVSFSVYGTDADAFSDAFEFGQESGEIEVKPEGSLDHERKEMYSITVSVTDGKDSSGNTEDPPLMDDSVNVLIGVSDVQEPGAVTLSPNAPVVGNRVTASLSDPDGVFTSSNSPVRWQWYVSGTESGSAFTQISNATTEIYVPVDADLGKRLRATAYYADLIATGRKATSAESDPVAAANRPAAGAPTISGTAQVGETLTATTTDITDANGLINVTFNYQWLADDTDITGATGSDYTLTASEAGKTIKVRVSFTDDAGNSESLISVATASVIARHNTPAAGSPTISGTTQVGETLTATTTDITDANGLINVTFNYQWLVDDTDITGATGSDYTLTASEAGKTIKVQVSFNDDAGNAEELTSAATASVIPQLSATIREAPDTHDGTEFTFELRFSETPKRLFSYKTLRDHAFTVTGGEVAHVRRLERGKNIRWEITVRPTSDDSVTVELPATTDCDAEGAICTDDRRVLIAMPATVIPGPNQQITQNSAAAGAPTISGTAQVGKTLTAVTTGITDADGLSNVTFTYQWLADDTDITDATDSDYTLTTSEAGKTVKVRVSFTDDESNAEALISAATAPVAARANTPAAGAPTISGTVQVREVLTAATPGITDADGMVNVTFTYEWQADGAVIDGATANAYTLTDDEKGSAITVRVFFTDNAGNPEARTSAATAPVAGPPLTATIHDAPNSHDGTEFTFELRFSEAPKRHFSYKTLRDHAFTVNGAEVVNASRILHGKNQRWEITVRPTSDDSVTIELPATTDCSTSAAICTDDERRLIAMPATVIPGPNQQITQNSAAAGAPTISGTAQVGKTLTAVTTGITDADGLSNVTFTYQWLAGDSEIAGATGSDYTLSSAEEGTGIKVRVSFTDDGSNAEELTSAATASVAARANTPAAGAPTISGKAQVEEVLTAATPGITDADGMVNVTFTYQWLANGTVINGATASTYTLTDDEKGAAITVRVFFTDNAGNPEARTSVATAPVVGPPLTATIHDAPTSHDGTEFTFELRFSEHFSLSYKTLWHHAFTVTGCEVSHVRRLERGKNLRWEITIRPSSNGTVTVELPATTDCDADGAICTDDERKLSGGLQVTVPRSG